MLTLYKKTERSVDNLNGFAKIKNFQKLNKPFLLCIAPNLSDDDLIYNTVEFGAQACRLYTINEIAASFKVNEFPVTFLGLKFIENHQSSCENEMVNKVLLPFLYQSGRQNIIKMARKINILTYSNGALFYKNIESKLRECLNKKGFTQEEQKNILSQISVTMLSTSIDISNILSTVVVINDLNDRLVFDKECNNKEERYGIDITDNKINYYYNGTGTHNINEYLKDNNIAKPVVCSAITYFIKNSIKNTTTDNLINISMEDLYKRIKLYSDDTKNVKFLMHNLDTSLVYNHSLKYLPYEIKMRQELDQVYQMLYKTKLMLELNKKTSKINQEKLNLIITELIKNGNQELLYKMNLLEKNDNEFLNRKLSKKD